MAGWLPGQLADAAAAGAERVCTHVAAAAERVAAGTDSAVLGLYCQLLSTLLVSAMALVAKVAGRLGLPAFELVLARSLVLLAMSTAMLWRQGGRRAQWPWRSARRALLLLRGLCGLGAISSLYLAVQWLPLSDTAVLAFLAPVFVAIAAPIVLREPAGRGVVQAMPLCIAGVLLVAQPTFLFGSGAQALSAVGVAFGIGQAVFSASAKLCIRSLNSTEPVGAIILSMACVSTAGSALACALLPGQWAWPRSATAWLLLAACGALGCGVQWLATTALKLSRAAPVLLMSYFGVVWGLLADLLIFHDAPNMLALAGAALVCGSSLLVVGFERAAAASGADGGGGKPSGRPPLAPKPKPAAAAALELAEGGRVPPGGRWDPEEADKAQLDERAPLVGNGAQR